MSTWKKMTKIPLCIQKFLVSVSKNVLHFGYNPWGRYISFFFLIEVYLTYSTILFPCVQCNNSTSVHRHN